MRPPSTDVPTDTADGERDLEKGVIEPPSPSHFSSPRTPQAIYTGERDLEKGMIGPPSPSHFSSPRTPRVVVSNSSKSLAVSNSFKSLGVSNSGKALLLSNSDKALRVSNSGKALGVSNSGKALGVSNSGKALGVSNSGKRLDQLGKKKYVKQVTGPQNDTLLHLAAQRGNLVALREIIGAIDEQMLEENDEQMSSTSSNAEVDVEVAELRSAVVNEANESGETALFIAAERGHIEVVKELLQYTTTEGIRIKNGSGFDAFHIAASAGHEDIVEILLEHDPELCKTVARSNATPLISAAIQGHVAVVNLLLSKDSSSLGMSKSNGKNALHFAARQGHVEIVEALLQKDPQLARRTDKKGQTALQVAVKGESCPVVECLLKEDSGIVMLRDQLGNTALHIATKKKRAEMVKTLLMSGKGTDVNALTRDQKTALDIAEELPLSEELADIKECLVRFGGGRANDVNQAPDELRNTVRELRIEVQNQLKQVRQTNRNMTGMVREIRKLHREGINNATNSVTVVAVLFATVAFAAIFTVPGGDDDEGKAVMSRDIAFRVFFLTNGLALFTSLSVVLVQITVVRREMKSERKVVEVINKLMWFASIFTSLAFLSSSYIVLGRHNRWAAIFVSVIGGVIMAGVLGSMTYYVFKTRKIMKVRTMKKEAIEDAHAQLDYSEAESNPVYAM